MSEGSGEVERPDVDVVVVGAGFAGLYLLHRLRTAGFSATCFEAAEGIGGTWYWNRYPGARCDIQSIDYSYSFDPELETEWNWSEKYATQPEILRYLEHVADKHDLKRDIRFETRVERAVWDGAGRRWHIRTGGGDELTCCFYVMATGCLSMPKTPEIDGADRFGGDVYFTSTWPHDGVDFTGKRVGVIGTGSSGIQSIPLIAAEAGELTVFQRTPNFSVPAGNGPVPAEKLAMIDGRQAEYREEARWSRGGVPGPVSETRAAAVSEEKRQARYEEVWEQGELLGILGAFSDTMLSEESNASFAEFIRDKIRSIVDDPETAEALCPKDHPFGTKRPCLDTDYYATYNLPHVRLVDLRKTPITTITETGVETVDGAFDLDAIVYATGFDAMTGAIVAVDIEGRDGATLRDKWADGPTTYLGLTTVGFPNLFLITGPGSPSVLSNMAVSIEQHVEWISETLEHLRSEGFEVIEPTGTAEDAWGVHVNDCADITLYPQANSWYMGANVPGKPRMFLPYIGGVDTYRMICNDVADRDYLGFELSGPDRHQRNDGVVFRLQPDVAFMLRFMAELGLPPLEGMTPDEARAFSRQMAAERAPGPDVGEVVDGSYPGAAGDLPYRLYRPVSPGPHPVIAYFHGGGWVLGDVDSDDPFCRDLCVQTDAVVVSFDYRHAPEHRFPAPVEDAFAAVRWLAGTIESLGGLRGQLVVAGWSAGANLATVVAQLARDGGGPSIDGQLLVAPVVDSDMTRPSYRENAEGYVLTTPLMRWFWDHYADDVDRTDSRAAPLRAESLVGLPPTVVYTAEFDPLRDEGAAYVDALSAAGVDARLVSCRGQIHTGLTATGTIYSSAPIRTEMAEAITKMFTSSVPA